MPTGTSELNKSNKKADLFRTNGNQFYSQKRFFDALIAYNQSLCHAELETESMGLTLANRSAVFLECNLYENALQNIKLAMKNKYPESKHDILNKRKQKCIQLKIQKKSAENPWDFLKLSYKPNEKLPFIVDCLDVKCDEKYGRYITTNRALKVGDIIAIEEPFCKIIKCDSRYSTCYESNCFQRCSHCLKENFLDLYPCKGCNLTMFCSDVCMESANNSYHNYECEMMDYFLESGIIHIVMRTFFKALSLFNGSIVELKAFLGSIKDQTVFDVDMSIDSKLNEKNKLIATYTLANNESKCDLKYYEILFLKHPKLKRMWTTNNQFITSFLSKLCHIGNQYVHGIGSWSLKEGGLSSEVAISPVNPSQLSQLIGNGIYTFSALLNHSCAPNVKRLNFEDKIILIVSRPIKENDQLFDSYRQNFNNQSKEERQAALLKDYNFMCDCEACTGNYPLNRDLEIVSEKLLHYAWKAHEQLPVLTPSQAKIKFHEICAAIEKNDKYFPCSEIIIFHECISNHLITATKPTFQFP